MPNKIISHAKVSVTFGKVRHRGKVRQYIFCKTYLWALGYEPPSSCKLVCILYVHNSRAFMMVGIKLHNVNIQ